MKTTTIRIVLPNEEQRDWLRVLTMQERLNILVAGAKIKIDKKMEKEKE